MNNKPIKTYEDLLQEEQRLTAQLATYKGLIKEDIAELKQGVKDKLNPIKQIKEKAKNLFVSEGKNGPALNAALRFATDFVIHTLIPKRTNILTKTVIPFLSRNYVTHMITDEQRKKLAKFVNSTIRKADRLLRKKVLKKQRENMQEDLSRPDVEAEAVAPPPHL